MKFKQLVNLGTEYYNEFNRVWLTARPSQQAAALSYYGMFSLAPAIFIAMTVAGLIFNKDFLVSQLYSQVETYLGPEVASFLQEALAGISTSQPSTWQIGAIIGFLALLYAAAGMFYEIQYSLNAIWGIPPPVRNTWGIYFRRYLFSFLMVIGLGLLLIITTMASLLLSTIGEHFDASPRLPVGNALAMWLVLTLVCAILYKIVPDAKVGSYSALIGGGIAGLILTLGATLLGLLFRMGFSYSPLAAAGAVAILLTALYYAMQIFLAGAIVTRVVGLKHREEAHTGG